MTVLSLPALKSSDAVDSLFEEEKTNFDVDPLACSVAFLRKTGKYGIEQNSSDIQEEDRVYANKIRAYYTKTWLWNNLKSDRPQSEFRNNALRLLTITENWQLTSRETGLFVKLPAFYEEDIVYDKYRKQFDTSRDAVVKNDGIVFTKKLEFLNKTFRWQKIERDTFWFKDDTNNLYGFTSRKHPFNDLFEEQVQTPRTFEFLCNCTHVNGMWYNTFYSFKILKEHNA